MPDPAAEGSSEERTARPRVLLEAGVLAALVVVATWQQRGEAGLQSPWLAFLALLVGPFFRRALVLAGRARPAPGWIFALEVAGLAGAFLGPVAPAWILLEGAAALASGWSGSRAREANPPGARLVDSSGPHGSPHGSPHGTGLVRRAPTALLALVLAALVLRDPVQAHAASRSGLGLLALTGAFVLAPGAGASVAACLRRVAAGGVLAAHACLAVHEEAGAAFTAGDATLALALVAGALEVLAYRRERTTAAPAPEGTRRALRLGFGVAVALLALILVPARLLAPERRIDVATLAPRALEGQARVATLPPGTLEAAAATLVLEDGRPLPLESARPEDVAALGSGRYLVDAGRVLWSSSDGTDPLANGRRYEVALRPAVHASVLARLVFGLAVTLLVLAWSRGAIDLARPSSPLERALVAGLVAASLAAALPARWDRVLLAADTGSYATHAWIRPPLYPWFLDATDARPQEPRRSGLVPDGERATPRALPQERFLGAVHAQKVLALLAVALLVWVLAGSLNAWLVGALAWVAILADAANGTDASVSFNVESLLTEGLDHSLVFLHVAAVVSYLRRPSWTAGLAVALLAALLLLLRPGNVALLPVFAWLFLRHLIGGEGARRALGRVLPLALVAALPILGACARTYEATGSFRLHSFTGLNVFCTSFDLATEEDLEAFPEPVQREFLRRCLRAAEPRRARLAPGEELYVNVTAHEIGTPVLEGMDVLPPEPRHGFVADDIFGAVGGRLIRRHPLGFLRLALRHVLVTFEPWTHVPVALVCLVALARLRRTRSPELLWFLFLATLPLVAIVPSCAFNFPILRYRSPLLWAELLAVPLFLALSLALDATPEPPLAREPGASP